jgi:selenocysteine lyase/cysteine desulfurase
MFKTIKKDFPIFQYNKSLVYFDSGATTQKPSCVIDCISEFYPGNSEVCDD